MFQIIADGSCDLSGEMLREIGVRIVPYYISVDGENYRKEAEELDVREFYAYMAGHPKVYPRTSLPSVMDYISVMEEYVKRGIDVLCICMTSKFSGSYNSAVSAKELLEEQYSGARIAVLDSTLATALEGLLVIEAAKMQRAGWGYTETVERLEEIKGTGRIFFTIQDLDYLMHGGRIGKLKGMVAGTIGLKPLITLREGEIFPNGIVHGRIKSRRKIMEQAFSYMAERGVNPREYAFAVGCGLDEKELLGFKDIFEQELKTRYPGYEPQVGAYQIGATIGVHTGPYPIGIGMLEKGRKED